MRKKSIAILGLLLLFVLAGCATARGIAQDSENLARGIKKSISKSE
ncbi:MAG: entericidin EcnA/B family protein [Candidatus Methylomirabilales bacterium]|jgi:predicted small secreted protein|nr:entericidin EcnA/B family protein [candidate division NC10 bacterium]MCH7896094.1 entericidin EcnA/B family protein [candidate division NC10 bacterium]